MENKVSIRKALSSDFDILYAFAKNTPELKVSSTEVFMDEEEFRLAMLDSNSVFLVAEIKQKIVGFIYASVADMQRPYPGKWACLLYIVVDPTSKRLGIATLLYQKCIAKLKEQGVSRIYCWANIEGDGAVVSFMKKQGFLEGHKYMWMDRKI